MQMYCILCPNDFVEDFYDEVHFCFDDRFLTFNLLFSADPDRLW